MKSFNELLQQYYDFKRQHSPYDYREWRKGGVTAKRCKDILNELAKLIKDKLIFNNILGKGDFKVEPANGVGYYPKSPWIGIFKKGECATNGVYPVLGFYNNSEGCFIGCAESFTNPQFGFQKKYSIAENCTEEEKEELKKVGLDQDSHLARKPYVFPSSKKISDAALLEALNSSLKIQVEYRRVYPRKDQESECDNREEENNLNKIKATWYKEIYVDEVRKWFDFVASPPTQNKDRLTWIYRGQGDASWQLESSLFRQFGSIGDRIDISAIEANAITTFKREAYDSQILRDLDGVDVLAVMQHYGSATRLLDFTYAPLTALFFAIEQRDTLLSNAKNYWENHARRLTNIDLELPQDVLDDKVALAIWAFKLRSVLGNYEDDLDVMLAKSTGNADKIILHEVDKNREDNAKEDGGVDVVLPKFGNERLSAQSGLFLMARNVGKSFEENLRVTLPNITELTKADCKCEKISAIADWSVITRKFSVIKFVFPAGRVEELRTLLKSLRITYKTIYPDLMGIAKEATAIS